MSSQSQASLKWSLLVLASFLFQVVPAHGQNFVWAKQMGGGNFDVGSGVALDGSGNVYTTGFFRGTADFDPGAGVFDLTSTSAGFEDIFVSKLDSNGNFVWAKKMGGTGGDGAHSVAVDGSGNVYTTGFFSGTADFDPGPGTFNLTSAGFNAIFVSKLDSNGNFVWAKQMGGVFLPWVKAWRWTAAAMCTRRVPSLVPPTSTQERASSTSPPQDPPTSLSPNSVSRIATRTTTACSTATTSASAR